MTFHTFEFFRAALDTIVFLPLFGEYLQQAREAEQVAMEAKFQKMQEELRAKRKQDEAQRRAEAEEAR